MSTSAKTFLEWHKVPIETLISGSGCELGIISLTLPLLERYIRESEAIGEATSLPDSFFLKLIKMFPDLNNLAIAKAFWKSYRHGLLHQATVRTANTISFLASEI